MVSASDVLCTTVENGGFILNRIKAILASAMLVAAALAPVSAAQAAPSLAVPKTSFHACDSTWVTFCVESVSIQSLGMAQPQTLTWVPSGTPGSVDATDPTAVQSVAGKSALPGRWTTATWGADGKSKLGYDGIFVDVHAANQFTNHMFFDVRPAKVDPATNAVAQANQVDNPLYAVSLSPDDLITFKVRVGAAITDVTFGIGNSISVTKGTDTQGNTLIISGTPTPVGVAGKASDCTGETGVAVANLNQLQATVIVANDDMGFGVDGVSGNLAIGTNGSCSVSTPVWDDASKSLSWTASAPHFAKDGVTVNKGFYKASIPVNDALLLWGLSNPKDAASALTVQITTEEGGSSAAITKVSVKNNKIIIDSSGFSYSKPNFKIVRNAKYKKWAVKKKLTCVDLTTKKVTKVTAYTCGAGTKQK
jgi:hypothetical protein